MKSSVGTSAGTSAGTSVGSSVGTFPGTFVRTFTSRQLLAIAAGCLTLCPAGARLQAQTAMPRADTRGLMFGAQLVGTTLSAARLNAKNELGSGVMIGYGITPWLTVFTGVDIGTGQIDAATVTDYDCARDCQASALTRPARPAPVVQPFVSGNYAYQHYDIGMRLTLPSASRAWAPFLTVAGSERRAQVERADNNLTPKSDLRGRAATIGAGVQYFIDRRWAFEGGAQYSNGKFNRQKQSGVISRYNVDPTKTIRFTGGVRFYPHVLR